MRNQDDHFTDAHDDDDDFVSKSQKKREMAALQQLGERLLSLRPAQIDELPITDDLREALHLGQRIRNKREGFRRQLQLIGKLMRKQDADAINQALQQIEQPQQQANERFHALEQLRDQVLFDGEAGVDSVLAEFPLAERQKLRQLQRQAKQQREAQKPPRAARELFIYLRDLQTSA
ncbi:ribosome biogenesis factor YjgA [Idiomarina xiamenensis]|uniref:Dual-action ribosomal maturation protein DarP n=1 Tax=Idiomarina xiamenensis 10-D-4 TaxID=740709 RepID=K2JPF5_9GAMM|nr:ribosome biogenesis factor YjgA [Idiomarina xiamenensis]EKE85386.1 hypothetical protein A10D4_03540 [Idiomarina xiamenensis 10-D-4]